VSVQGVGVTTDTIYLAKATLEEEVVDWIERPRCKVDGRVRVLRGQCLGCLGGRRGTGVSIQGAGWKKECGFRVVEVKAVAEKVYWSEPPRCGIDKEVRMARTKGMTLKEMGPLRRWSCCI
jgi:hypothetical protein